MTARVLASAGCLRLVFLLVSMVFRYLWYDQGGCLDVPGGCLGDPGLCMVVLGVL